MHTAVAVNADLQKLQRLIDNNDHSSTVVFKLTVRSSMSWQRSLALLSLARKRRASCFKSQSLLLLQPPVLHDSDVWHIALLLQ